MKKIIVKFWPVLFIFSVWFIFASPYFFKGLVPFPSKYLVTFFPPWNAAYGMPVKNNAMPDVITQIYPWKKLTIDTWKKGEIPLWNPYSFSGTAHLGNYQSAVLSPFNLLFFVLPQIDAWSLLVLLQPLLAGLFMYIFLKEIGRSDVGSTIGSIAFMFCGFLVVWMAYATLGYAALFLPFILWAMHKVSVKGSWWYGVLVSAGLAFSFFSGHFQISLYVAALSLAYAIVLEWRKPAKMAQLISYWLAGVFLAMPQILPAYEVYGNAVRSDSFVKGEIIPWQYLITLFAPDFFGNPVTRNDWFGHYAEWAGFIGVTPFFLALLTLGGKKGKEQWFFWTTGFIALLFALPTPLNEFLFRAKIPAISTSAASRIIILVSFSLAALSSFGFDRLVQLWKEKNKTIVFFSLSVVLCIVALWGLLFIAKPLPVDKLIVAKRNLILPSLIALGALCCFVVGRMNIKSLTRFLPFVLLVLTAFDLVRFAIKWMPFDPREYVYPSMPVIQFLRERVSNDRVFGNFGNELATMFGIPTLEGYDAVYQRRYGEFVTTFSKGQVEDLGRSVVLVNKAGNFTEDMLELLGVRYVLHRVSDGRNIWAYPIWNYPYYRQVYKDEQFEVYENTEAFPRAFLASSYYRASSDEEILGKLFDPTTDRRQTIILEEEPMIKPQEGSGEVTLEEYRPTRVKLLVKSDVPKLLFMSDVYDKGWKATIDGQSVKVLRADYDFRAVAVPVGDHAIEFRYQPQSFRVGLIVAAFSIVFLLWGSMRQLRYAHRIL